MDGMQNRKALQCPNKRFRCETKCKPLNICRHRCLWIIIFLMNGTSLCETGKVTKSRTHMKNWEPLVSLPLLAIDNRNSLSCLSTKFSSVQERNSWLVSRPHGGKCCLFANCTNNKSNSLA